MPLAYYDCKSHGFWLKSDDGHWTSLTKETLETFLRRMGGNPKPGTSSQGSSNPNLSEIEETICRIVETQQIDFQLDVAGWPAGVHDMFGRKVLVRESPKLFLPQKGDYNFFETLLKAIAREHPIQYDVLKSWLKLGLARIYDFRPGFHQVLFLVGHAACGKSLFQYIVTVLVGGGVANPEECLTGNQAFNRDLHENEHLASEEPTVHNFKDRQKYANGIKTVAASFVKRCRGLYSEAVSACPIQMCSISTNMEYQNLTVIPDLESGTEDKFHAIMFPEGTMPLEGYENLTQAQIQTIIKEQAPAFLWHLFNEYVVPPSLLTRVTGPRHDCERFGMDAFHHPEIVDMLRERSSETITIAVLTYLANHNAGLVQGTTAVLASQMTHASENPDAVLLGKNPRQLAYNLKSLHKKFPKMMQKVDESKNGNTWLFIAPTAESN
jgi:hypothetical protein